MYTDLSPRTKAATFYLLTLGLCTAVAVAMRSAGEGAAVVAMLTPLTAVLIMQIAVTRDGWHRDGWRPLGVHRLGLRYWPAALAVPVLVLAGSEGVVGLTGLTDATWSALPSPVDLVIELVVLGLFAFCEEIGWRGYLLPLVSRGRLRASFGVGLLHGLFHLPVVFVVPGAYLTESSRWVMVPLFLVVMTVAGGVYGWLRERSGSVWPAVVTHAVFNLTVNVITDVWTTSSRTVALVGRETGLATLTLLVVAAVVLCTRPAGTRPAHPSHPLDHGSGGSYRFAAPVSC